MEQHPQLLPPESKEFESKVIIITGGASGIGRAAFDAFTEKGAHVVVFDIAPKPEGLTQSQYKNVDVSKWEEVEPAVNEVAREFNGIDIAISNAAMKVSGNLLELPSETFAQLLKVNALGPWNLAKAAMPHLIKSKGTLLFVSSGTSENLPANADGYFMSKGATYTGPHALQASFGDKITIRAIAPGPVDTPLWREGKSPTVIEKMLAGNLGPKVETPQKIAQDIISLASRNNAAFNGKILRL